MSPPFVVVMVRPVKVDAVGITAACYHGGRGGVILVASAGGCCCCA